MSKLDRALSIFLVVAIVATIGYISYIAATPKKGDKFTEFYILGAEGEAANYPEQGVVGEPVYVTVGIINHEFQPASYRAKITIDDTDNKEVNVGTLSHGEKWEQKVSFTPKVAGEKQMVSFYLYKDDGIEPYLKNPLRLYIDVTSP